MTLKQNKKEAFLGTAVGNEQFKEMWLNFMLLLFIPGISMSRILSPNSNETQAF